MRSSLCLCALSESGFNVTNGREVLLVGILKVLSVALSAILSAAVLAKVDDGREA